MNFVKQIATGKVSNETHHALVRFSIGIFEREEFTIKVQKAKIALAAGLDFVNPFQRFLAQHAAKDAELMGGIPTTRDVVSILAKYGVTAEAKVRHGKAGKKYEFTATLSPDKLKRFVDDLYDFYLLFDVVAGDYKLTVKKETPKIGSLSKRFIKMDIPLSAQKDLIDEFLFDAGVTTFKAATVVQTFVIEQVIVDEKLLVTDPLRARLEAKRKGILKRKITVDNTLVEKEYRFEV